MKITLIASTSLDGKIANNSHELVNWTSREDKKNFYRNTMRSGVLVMGYNTFMTFPSPLPKRLNVVLTEDASLTSEYDNVLFHDMDIKKLVKEFEKKGQEEIHIGGGCYTYTEFLNEKLATHLDITVESKLFGEGLSFLGKLNVDFDMELVEKKDLSDTTFNIVYKINYK